MLSPAQIETIVQIFKPYQPKRVGVFGSVVRNEETMGSDIDILYRFKDGITLFQLAKLKIELEEQLGKEVDLVSEDFISKYFKDKVLSELKVLYEA